jgi:ABC-type nitrate/sulfonate/bicarbonate transport system substrate-binding protein
MTKASRREYPLSRRSFLRYAGAGGLAATAGTTGFLRSARAESLTKVKMTLAWLPEGSYAYAFVAKEQGYWKKRGLDVDIARGYGSMTAAQAVSAGQFDFGMANPSSVILLATKGIELASIGLMDYNPNMAVGLLEDSPIRKPKDLEGHTVGQTLTSSDAAFFPVFCAKNGVDISKVQRFNMDAKVRNQSLSEKRVDAITGLVSSMLPAIGSLGIKTRYLLYTDYNVSLYGNIGLVTQPKTVKERPEICQAFVDGLSEGLKFTLTEPKEAQKIFLKAVPALTMSPSGAEFARLGIGVQRFSVLSSPDPRLNGLAYADLAKVKSMADLVMQYQAAPGSKAPDLDKIFTNRFAGHVRLTDAEWKAVEDNTVEITKLLRAI